MQIINDLFTAQNQLRMMSLRYFNPIGAHPTGLIGELPVGKPNNLLPFISQTAAGLHETLVIFGDNYPTPDGTCIRDYIHVVDLAKAHVLAIERLVNNKNTSNYETYNIGTGKGSTVLEVINSFEKISNTSLNYSFAPRRSGDVVEAYADNRKVSSDLGWRAESSLDDAMLSAWNWENKLKNKS